MSQVGNDKPSPLTHVAIIMDGNGRWAKSRGLQRTAGHRRGAEAAKKVVRAAAEMRIPYLTLFSFSSENWLRPADEVDDLMGLLRFYLRSEIGELHNKGVRLRVIGDRSRVPKDIVRLIEHTEKLTADNTTITVVIALSYGGRQEIVDAARRIAVEVEAGTLRPAEVDEAALTGRLYAPDIPDPDLVIRTSGEKRISNFLLWQAAYAEYVFVETLWPDFDSDVLASAVDDYSGRERRFGGVGAA